MIRIKQVGFDVEGLREKILWIDKRCYKRDVQFNEDTLNTFLDKNSKIYFIISRGKRDTIVGYMLLSLYNPPRECYLTSMAILPTYRNYGIGKKLFKIFLKHRKGHKLSLHAVNPAMIHIAEKNGFRKVRTTRNYFGKHNAVLMEG